MMGIYLAIPHNLLLCSAHTLGSHTPLQLLCRVDSDHSPLSLHRTVWRSC